ncbi:MAG: glutamate--tRNA ligase, partial [Kiritimatiellae bacterium]|nr:glutamate--tRNA ligase [Kiritimatiellia bacterium]
MTNKKTVRTRVAPSPTGAPHIGTAYIALFNYAFAKKHDGEFILRIEDTDQTRSTSESETEIFDALKWVGINADESPAAGGPKGPYRQSERTDIYRQHCNMLVENDKAYPCFCSSERLTELRKEQLAAKEMVGYDGLCSTLSKEDAQKRIDNGESYVIRMRVPESGDCVFNDRLRGEISIPWTQVDQQVLMKSDGFPTYHLANVVDDH